MKSHKNKYMVLIAIFVMIFETAGMYEMDVVKAASGTMTVEIESSIALSFDESANAFVGTGNIQEFSDDAHLHRIISVSLPESFEMTTPKGIKPAPDGTVVHYDGQMSARRGYYNNTNGDGYFSTLSVTIPLTEDFKDYGAGEYSLIVPVELMVSQTYGSYSSDFVFSEWSDLVSGGDVNVEGSTLVSVLQDTDVLEIPPDITSISSQFAMLANYREVDVPETVISASHAFKDSYVREVYFEGSTVPERVCTLARYLEKVVLADGVTTFGEEVFMGCDSLHDMVFPSTMSTLGLRAFDGCSSLTEMTITTNLTVKAKTSAGSPFKGSGISHIVVQDGVTDIPARLYCSAGALTELVLPISVVKIGSYAFDGASNVTVYYAGTAEQWSKVKLNGFSPKQVIYGSGTMGLLGASNMLTAGLEASPDFAAEEVLDGIGMAVTPVEAEAVTPDEVETVIPFEDESVLPDVQNDEGEPEIYDEVAPDDKVESEIYDEASSDDDDEQIKIITSSDNRGGNTDGENVNLEMDPDDSLFGTEIGGGEADASDDENDDEDPPIAPDDFEDASMPLKDPDDDIIEILEVTGF